MENERKLNGLWNAERVLQEYLCFADGSGRIKEVEFDDSPNGIKQRRLATVLKVYGRNYDELCEQGWIIDKSISPERMAQVRSLLKHILEDDRWKQQVENPRTFRFDRDVQYLFKSLFRYRKSLYDLEHIWSGILECPRSVTVVVYATEDLYNKHIKEVCKTIDKLLILLMGDIFDRSFTEEELLPFGYPDVTDEELDTMILDNL